MSRMALLLPILVALIIGIVVLAGWLIWYFTRRGSGRTAPAASTAGPDGQSAAAAGTTPLYLLGIKRGDEGAWAYHVQGIRYATLAAVPDPELREEVRRAIRDLGTFLGRTPPASRAGDQVPSPDRASLRATGPDPFESAEAIDPAMRRTATPGGSIPVIDFAQEITAIIEELQARSPGLQGHAVTLRNAPGGGITFLVDGHVYSDIGDIPNPELQALIRQATKEWERR